VLLLPLRREDDSLRRFPRLSAVLVALNVVSLIAVSLWTDEAALIQRLGQMVAYLREHPYLEPSAGVTRHLDAELLAELAEKRRAFLSRQMPPAPEAFETRQRALTERERDVLAEMGNLPMHRLGFVPARAWSPSVVSSLFVHAGWLHLLGNMFFLWIAAPLLEARLGRIAFLALYLCSGIAACGAHALRFPDSDIPLVGASGAVAGLLGAFLVFYGRQRIRFLVVPTPVTVTLPALVVFPFWFLEQMWFAREAATTGVAYTAHEGGFVFGLAAAGLLRIVQRGREGGPPRVREADVQGDLQAYEEALVWQDRDAIDQIGCRLMEDLQKSGDHLAALELVANTRPRVPPPVPAKLWLAFASLLERHDREGALVVYQEVIEGDPAAAVALRAILRRGDLLRRQGDLEAARKAYEQARAHPTASPGSREAAERALVQLGRR
jgi:membrane associated rhomboid family serine protease